MRPSALSLLALLALLTPVAACSGGKDDGDDTATIADDTQDDDTGDTNADDSAEDSGGGDSGGDDSGDSGDSGDTGEPSFEPLDGLGALSGDCGVLTEALLTDPAPGLYVNTLDFGAETFDPSLLSEGGQVIYEAGNLGGSSLLSEVFAYEVLYRCELAALLKTEAEIVYTDSGGKKTDLLVEIDGLKLGVSVTRAYHYPPDDPYTLELATELLTKKLGDLPLSTANVAPEDAWVKQLLSILAYTPEHAALIEESWLGLDDSLRGDAILIVTVTEGDDEELY
ncbi:hypothetical protein L6R49_04210 [Myxococcota bacterium]|nr:hypothetical protein [Myxococcota bacterium]